MAVRNLRFLGDDILLKPCKRIETVTDRIRILAEDMIETMRVSKGVGLAAPQVGILKRIMVVEVEEGNPIVFINPEITEKEAEELKEPHSLNLIKIASRYSDAITTVKGTLPQEAIDYIQGTGKPFLQGETIEATCKVYPQFYKELMHK